MTILAAQGQNDARTTARLLATTARDCLDDPNKAPALADVLNNVHRLLEAYRVNKFFGLEPATRYHHAAETVSLAPRLEQNVGNVRDILERAVATAFAGQSKDEAVAEVTRVLQRVAHPEFGVPSDAERAKTVRFFSEVVQELQLS